MSTTVEQRTVEMRFDNAQFERNIAKSQASLQAFNENLGELGGAKSGIGAFITQLKGITFDPINNGIHVGIGRLAALTAAMTGVSNLATDIYNKVSSTVKSMSGLQNIASGWEKYNTKTESVQTIMAAVRKDGESAEMAMSRVNEQLEQLIFFSDETSYSMNEMTSAVGTFTSNGIELSSAVDMVQGIALAAASAGVSTRDASRAFRQLGQAMSLGALKVQDYSSLEQLNFNTTEFQKNAIKAAVAVGTLREENGKFFTESGDEVSAGGAFRNTLQEGWFDRQVMEQVFNEYGKISKKVKALVDDNNNDIDTASDAIEHLKEVGVDAGEELSLKSFELGQEAKTFAEAIDSVKDAASSKFMEIFESIFGNYVQAKELWTTLANDLWDIFVGPIDNLKDAFKEVMGGDFNGREKTLNSIKKIFYSIWDTVSKFKETWNDIWQPDKVTLIENIVKTLQKFSNKVESFFTELQNDEVIWENLKTFFQGLKDIVDMVKSGFSTLISKFFKPTEGHSMILLEFITKMLASFGELLTKIATFVNEHKIFERVFDTVIKLGDKVKKIVTEIVDVFKKIFVIDKHPTIMWQLGNEAIEFRGPLEVIRDILMTIARVAGNVIVQMTPLISAVWAFIKSVIQFLGKVVEGFAPVVQNALIYLTKGLTEATNVLTEFLSNMDFAHPLQTLKDILTKIAQGIGKVVGYIVDGFMSISNVGGEGGDKEPFYIRMAKAIGGFSEELYQHREAVEWVRDIIWGQKDLGAIMIDFATALSKLASTIMLSLAGFKAIMSVATTIRGLFGGGEKGIGGVLVSLKTSIFDILGKMAMEKLVTAFSKSILMFAGSLFLLAMIPSDRIVQAAITLAIGIGIITFAVKSILKLADMIGKSDVSNGVATGTQVALNGPNGLKGGFQHVGNSGPISAIYAITGLIVALGAACLMMAGSIAIIGTLANWDSALIGFVGMLAIIGSMTGMLFAIRAMNLQPEDSKIFTNIGIYFITVGIAMKAIAKAISVMAQSDATGMKLLQATGMMEIIMTTLFLAATYAIALRADEGTLKALAKMFTSFGVLFLAMAGVMWITRDFSENQMLQAFQIIGVMTGVIAALAVVSSLVVLIIGKSANETQDSTLKAFALVILSVIGLVISIVGMIVLLMRTVEDPKMAIAALAVVGAVIVAAVGTIGLVSSTLQKAKPENLFAFAAAVVALGVALLAMTPAFAVIGQMDIKQVGGILLLIAGIFALILGASAIIGNFQAVSTGLIILAGALTAIAISSVIASAGIVLIGIGFEKIANAFKTIVELGPAAGEQILSMMTAFGQGITEIFKGVGNGFIEIFNIITANEDVIFDGVSTLFGIIIKAFTKNIPKITDYFMKLYDEILNIVTTYGPKLYEMAKQALKDLLNLIIKIVTEYLPQINQVIDDVTTDAIYHLCLMVLKQLPMINETLSQLILSTSMTLADNLLKMTDLIVETLDELADKLIFKLPVVMAKVTAVVTATGVSTMIGFIGGLIVGIHQAMPVLVDQWATSFVNMVNRLCEVIENRQDEVREAFGKLITVVGGSLIAMVTMVDDTVPEVVREWAKTFVKMVDDLCDVINEQEEAVYDAVKKLIETVLWTIAEWMGRLAYDATAGGTKNPFSVICGYMKDGFVYGFASEKNKTEMFKAGTIMAGEVNKGYKSGAAIASPSKVFFENGVFTAQGLINGIKSKFGNVKETGLGMASALKDAFTGAFGGLENTFSNLGNSIMNKFLGEDGKFDISKLLGGNAEGLFENIDMNNLTLQITPELDMSKINSQVGDFEDLFANKQVMAIADVNDWSAAEKMKADSEEFMDSVLLKNKMSDMADSFKSYIGMANYNKNNPVQVNVALEGDASKMLKVLRAENSKQLKATGTSMLNTAKNHINRVISNN